MLKLSNNRNRLFLFCSLLVSLSACTTTADKNSEVPTETVLEPQLSSQELVVEGLVSEADILVNLNIEGAEVPVGSEASEEIIHRNEPRTPTVAMTANRIVERSMNDYLKNRRKLLRIWIERGNTYFPMIEKIFEEEGVPEELKYIALGESGLRPRVRSGAGAVGMWQFMPATGRGAGLDINSWVDERMDPEKATRAAAQHMKELYISYSGNWHLVLAGYNCSYRCISRAVQKAGGSIDNPPSFWEIYPYLPRETREFIPKFISTALIVSNPELYGIHVEELGQELSYDTVQVSGMLSLEEAATLAGIDLTGMINLNPSLQKASLPDSLEPFPLKIPFGSYDSFVNNFNRLPVEAKVSPSEYIIQSGDTLGKIARQFDTTLADLQTYNGISGHMIHPNQKLLIPGTGVSTTIEITSTARQFTRYGEGSYRPIKLGEEFQLVEQSGSTEKNPLMAVSLSVDVEDEFMVPTIYKVRSGDTLSQISQRFNISLRDIKQWNNISGNTIYANQELTFHTMTTATLTPTNTSYRVQRGDNLYGIARRFGVSVANLKRWNGLNDNLIFPGQDLQLN